MPDVNRHHSSAVPLALAWAGLTVYASLYPFSGWRLPGPAVASSVWAILPWPRWSGTFDVLANFAAYAPLGFLSFAAAVRSHGSSARAFGMAVLVPAVLSYALELTQYLLPARVPSRLDWLLNAGGAAAGALSAATLQRLGVFERWQTWRERWFVEHSGFALALLLLWPIGLLFPAPVPLGVGQVLDRVREQAVLALLDTPWSPLVDSQALSADGPAAPLGPLAETLAIGFGLLAPCALAYSITRTPWRRMVLAFGATALGLCATTLSTMLNFGPEHALAWLTPRVLPATGVAVLLALAMAWLPRRAAAAVGLVAVTALIALVSRAPTDPYFAQSLQGWEQGRFIRFHGASQWIGWLWPYVLLCYLLVRVGAPDPDRPRR